MHRRSWHTAAWLMDTETLKTAGRSTAMIPATRILHSADQLIAIWSLFHRLSRNWSFMIFFLSCIIFWQLYVCRFCFERMHDCIVLHLNASFKFIPLVSVGKASSHMQFGSTSTDSHSIESRRLRYPTLSASSYVETASGSTRHCCLHRELLKEQRDGEGRERWTNTVYVHLFCEFMLSNEWTGHSLSHSPRRSPFWTLSCSAEESTPSSGRPDSAVIAHSQQRAAAGERRQEENH